MKKIFLLTLLLSSYVVFSQGHFEGQKSLGVTYLGVEKGYGANVIYQQFIGRQYFGYRIDLDYFKKNHDLTVLDHTFNNYLERYAIGSAVVYSFEDLLNSPFYLQAYLGGVLGKEKINQAKGEIETIKYINPKTNIYGGYIGVELEIAFQRRISLIVNAQNTFTNSEIKKSLFNYNIGMKYILNY